MARRSYQEYLVWLSQDEGEQKRLGFEKMSRGWSLGCEDFKKGLVADEKIRTAALQIGDDESQEARGLVFADDVARLASLVDDAAKADTRKIADWKISVAALLKERTTATIREIATRPIKDKG